jgi:hypothetical protein
MPYILNKTNGIIVAVVQDASIDQTTDLQFLGKNYAGYGEIQNENFLKLLENFANITPPSKPIEGQVWYDSINKSLNVYDAIRWRSVPTIIIDSLDLSKNVIPILGDLWYDIVNRQLKIWTGTEYGLIGPLSGADSKATWRGDYEYDIRSPDIPVFNTKAIVGVDNTVVAIVSNETYDMYSSYTQSPTYPTYVASSGGKPGFTKIIKGISLFGADPITGSSRNAVTGLSTSSYFWGTAAESLSSLVATTSTFTRGFVCTTTATNASFNVPFINSGTNLAYIDSGITYNPSTKILTTVASSALYADLAERYEADAVYDKGTVLVIGGEKEVTVTTTFADTRVAGIVSKNPAYMMNSEAGTDETHPYIALKGRVPCKVQGYIKKGDLIVTSSTPGYGIAASNVFGGAIIGKALGTQSGGFGVIEVLVV